VVYKRAHLKKGCALLILIALGANLSGRHGSPEETLEEAKLALEARGVSVTKSSRVWLTAPVPASDQPWYRNAVICVDTALDVRALFRLLKEIEQDFGRADTVRNAARVLDLDLIAYHSEIVEENRLVVPHPRMEGRAFVLLPLQEAAAGWIHPVTGKTVAEMIGEMPEGQDARPLEHAS
jgi:2-amino-4-hydroxy-6-hydroxymethyldihydropteridine diphosphokinase